MRARRAPRAPRDPAAERDKIASRSTEQWIDEGSVRDEAVAATRRSRSKPPSAEPSRPRAEIDPLVGVELTDVVGIERGKRLTERLAQAADALDRERFDEAKRVAGSVAKEVPTVAAAHEIVGLANYRLGHFKPAVRALEAAKELKADPALYPVLADSYRALRRWASVERVWLELREASPSHEVMAEGRIVVASAHADRGDLRGALEMMHPATRAPKKVRAYHLRQWYVIADLYDRLGDPIAARRWFSIIASHDDDFADVNQRLRLLGA